MKSLLSSFLLAFSYGLLPLSLTHGQGEAPEAPEAQKIAESDHADASEMDALAKAAAAYVEAYNKGDAKAVAALFTEDAELVATDGSRITGRDEIQSLYQEIFSAENADQVAIEAVSVSIPGDGVAVEEGILHLTSEKEDTVRSIAYTAIHVKQEDGTWRVAQSRSEEEVTAAEDILEGITWLVGDWSSRDDSGGRLDLTVDLSESGKFLIGKAVSTDGEGNTLGTDVRIGWNPATQSIYWWTFDEDGGYSAGPWAAKEKGWVIQNSGFSSDAEAQASTQSVKALSENAFEWALSNRILEGELLPDSVLQFVRLPAPLESEETDPAPKPASEPSTSEPSPPSKPAAE